MTLSSLITPFMNVGVAALDIDGYFTGIEFRSLLADLVSAFLVGLSSLFLGITQ